MGSLLLVLVVCGFMGLSLWICVFVVCLCTCVPVFLCVIVGDCVFVDL